MRFLIAIAAVSVVIASTAVTINAIGAGRADARPAASASRYTDPLPGMAKSLKAIAKTNQAELTEIQALRDQVGSYALSSLADQLHEVHTVLGSSQGIFSVLGELTAINGNTR